MDHAKGTYAVEHSQLTSPNACCFAGMPLQDEQAKHFIKLWTLKEAYVKAVGRGIMAAPGMSLFLIDLDEAGFKNAADESMQSLQHRIHLHPDSDGWNIVLIQMDQDHIAALCVEQCSVSGPSDAVADTALREPVCMRMWMAALSVDHESLTLCMT